MINHKWKCYNEGAKDPRQYEATLIDPIVTLFPEITDRKRYNYGSQLSALINSSFDIIYRSR